MDHNYPLSSIQLTNTKGEGNILQRRKVKKLRNDHLKHKRRDKVRKETLIERVK